MLVRYAMLSVIALLPGVTPDPVLHVQSLMAWQRAIAGCAAYCTATVVSSPVDVVKTRLQMQKQDGRTRALPLAVSMFRREGALVRVAYSLPMESTPETHPLDTHTQWHTGLSFRDRTRAYDGSSRNGPVHPHGPATWSNAPHLSRSHRWRPRYHNQMPIRPAEDKAAGNR